MRSYGHRFFMIDTLYYYAYYSYLKSDLDSTRMYFEMLRDEYNARKDKNILNNYQLKELKAIRTAIASGMIAKNIWVEETSVPTTKDTGTPVKQTELVKRIYYEATDSLKQCLQSDNLYLYNIEHPCGGYGRVDMVYMDDVIAYPTEIKPAEGRHDILGQIAKYTLYFRMLLHIKHFKSVQPVTICNSYDKHTLAELKRMSVTTLRYYMNSNKVHVALV